MGACHNDLNLNVTPATQWLLIGPQALHQVFGAHDLFVEVLPDRKHCPVYFISEETEAQRSFMFICSK